MAATVATPLERAMGRIAGVTELTSSSSLGNARVTLQFELSKDINSAAREVQAAIQAARTELPSSLPNNPTYRKVNPADAPILILAMTSETFSRGQMYDMASTNIAQRISQIAGVGQVTVGGGSLPAVRVELNPTVLNKLGIGFDEVRTAITSTNANRPKGFLEEGDRYWQIQANDQAKSAAEYLPSILAYRNGAAERPRDPHPRDRRADLPRRHLRRDVPARLQPEQPLAHGAHHRHGLRRRRRDRGPGERLAPYRKGHGAVQGGAPRRARGRLHGGFDEPVARRRLHP